MPSGSGWLLAKSQIDEGHMRALLVALLASILVPLAGSSHAVERAAQAPGSGSGKSQYGQQTYRGYVLDLSGAAGRQDAAEMLNALRQQIDVVESAGLSPRVLKFFRSIPILVDEKACLAGKVMASACYGSSAPERAESKSRGMTVWDSEKAQWTNPDPVALAEDMKLGVVMVRPHRMTMQEPLILHELLHAYHARMMPAGVQDAKILGHYDLAKSQQLYPADAYVVSNEREFFAVTASVFLYGKADKEPFTRAKIKEKQPDYYRYLVWLFGFDPDRAPNAAPVASATVPDPAATSARLQEAK
jgi:hypothetical protein